jgi:hypothetical protein
MSRRSSLYLTCPPLMSPPLAPIHSFLGSPSVSLVVPVPSSLQQPVLCGGWGSTILRPKKGRICRHRRHIRRRCLCHLRSMTTAASSTTTARTGDAAGMATLPFPLPAAAAGAAAGHHGDDVGRGKHGECPGGSSAAAVAAAAPRRSSSPTTGASIGEGPAETGDGGGSVGLFDGGVLLVSVVSATPSPSVFQTCRPGRPALTPSPSIMVKLEIGNWEHTNI